MNSPALLHVAPGLYTRRQLLQRAGCGFGYLALAALLNEHLAAAAPGADPKPLAPHPPHFPASAKRVIFLFMHGGPSHIDTFDPKPLLTRDHGKPYTPTQTGVPLRPGSKLLASPWEFDNYGDSGLEISALFPETARLADDLCVLRGMHTNGQDHSQAVLKLHTGHESQARPSLGSWVLYGLGTQNQNLPGFVTLSPPSINGGAQNYGAAFLPSVFQGAPIAGDSASQPAMRHIRNPELARDAQRVQLDFLQDINRDQAAALPGDSQIDAVIESYELAFRMQREAPQLADISGESPETLQRYGVNESPTDAFGRQCLLARRFAESGVRFVQVSHAFKWDQHINLKRDHERNAREVDKPIAALLADLKSRGLLKDTLVVWSGEFGRTPTGENNDGRDHNPAGYSVWLAGGGVKGGMAYGATDDYGFAAVENKVHLHDLHATLLHLLGLDHKRLTYRHAGRDFRLTDVRGEVVRAILA